MRGMHCPARRRRAGFIGIAAGICAALLSAGAAEPLLKKGDRIAVVGDSITEQKLYSKYMELYLLACVPQLELTLFQFGWGGERAPGFARRMDNDCVPWKPTVVTTCFGMNDGSYRPYAEAIGQAYEAGSRRIQKRFRELGARMVIGGPGPVDTDTWRAAEPDADVYYNDNLGRLSATAAKLAAENGFAYAGLHPLMMRVMADAKTALGKGYAVCGGDGVHPGPNGHLVMAYAFLKAMGLDGEIGTVTVDLKGAARATEGHRVVSADKGNVTIESRRYPFCFFGDPKSSGGNRSILPFLPFNRDLNRFTLKVQNLGAETAEVRWGDAARTFTRAQLEAGVNLADAFLDNPFAAAFGELDRMVSAKQARETRTIKSMITHMPGLEGDFKDDPATLEALRLLRNKLMERSARDAAEARAAVKPVTHTIRITAK